MQIKDTHSLLQNGAAQRKMAGAGRNALFARLPRAACQIFATDYAKGANAGAEFTMHA